MNCKNCGAQIDDNAKFCPTCGHTVTASTQANPTGGLTPRWFKWLLGAFAIICATAIFFLISGEDLTNTVEDQLKAIRENKIPEAYYNYTSKEFQEATPLDKFKEFVKSYPAFAENSSVRFTDRKSDEEMGTLDAVLMTKSGKEINAQYRLVQDKTSGKWKIQSVKFEDTSAPQVEMKQAAPADEQAARKVVEAQMDLIHKKEFKKAYTEQTSSNFKKSTPEKQFFGFVNTQPGFFNYQSIAWDRSVTDGKFIVLTGSMTTTDGQKIPIAFQLENEDKGWKVLQIQVGTDAKPVKEGAADASKKMEFSQFVLGSDVDEEGIVLQSKETFPSSAKEIYLNLYIANGTTDAKINIELEHKESSTKIPPVATTLKEDGHAILRIVFSPPPNGWPKGNYQVVATSSTGAKKTYDFKIE